MIIRYFHSFIFSLLIHAIVAFFLFFIYTQLQLDESIKEKNCTVCIRLVHFKANTPAKHIYPKKSLQKPQINKISTKKKGKTRPLKRGSKISVKKEKTVVHKKPISRVQKKVNRFVQKNTMKERSIDTHKDIATKKIISKKKVVNNSLNEERYKEKNLAKIVEILQENLYYPRRARKRGVEGKVIIRFTLSKTSDILDIKVLSSKSEILSRSAIQTIKNIKNKLPNPKKEITIKVPVVYSLH